MAIGPESSVLHGMVDIAKSLEVPAPVNQILDPSLLKPTHEEWSYLCTTISEDTEEVKERILEIQKKQVLIDFINHCCISDEDTLQIIVS